MKSLNIIMFAVITILSVSCSSSNKTVDPLIDDIWMLEFLKDANYNPQTETDQRPSIEIHLKDNKVTGNTGCNTMNGNVTIEEDQITFADIVTTKKFCSRGIEPEFLIALGMVNNYKIEKMELHLYQDDEELMIFQKVD
jgi:heat shock protein HslJ